jgi:hypothetical protein
MQTIESYDRAAKGHQRDGYSVTVIDKYSYGLCHRRECGVWYQPWYDGYEHAGKFYCSTWCMLADNRPHLDPAAITVQLSKLVTPRMREGLPEPKPPVSTFDMEAYLAEEARFKARIEEVRVLYERRLATDLPDNRCGKPRTDGKPCRQPNPCPWH